MFFLITQLPCIASQTVIQSSKPKLDVTNKHSRLQHDLNTLALMSAQDLSRNGSSNLNLTNNTGEALNVFGVYLYGVASITPGLDCINGIAGGSNSTIDAYMSGLITPIKFAAGQSVPIGQNYLYNMLYAWIYFRVRVGGNVTCSLPGCTWPTDTPQNWCFQLGAISPDAPYTFSDTTANIVPFSWAPAEAGHDYNLISDLSYVWLGPFTCDDKTLTCTTIEPQYQPFPS